MQLSPEQIHHAALLARRNAKQFFLDAKILLSKKSYGHAYGMLVFAEEETGKALIFHALADGWFRNPEWITIATGRHQAKQATMALIVAMRLLFFVLFGLAPNETMVSKRKKWLKKKNGPSMLQIAYENFQRAADDVATAINTIADIFEELSGLGQLQSMREKGFFVDFAPSGAATGPHQFSAAECRRAVKLVKVRLAAADEFLGGRKFSLTQRRAATNIDVKAREQIASLEEYLFSKKGAKGVIDWLTGDEPRDIVRAIRQFAADEAQVDEVRRALSEMLTKAPHFGEGVVEPGPASS